MSLNDVYSISFKHALQNIERNGGKINDDTITIKAQQPATVKFEKSFTGLFPVLKFPAKWSENKDEINFDFKGTGFVIQGNSAKWTNTPGYIFDTGLYVDDKLVDSIRLPVDFTTRRYDVCWKYDLQKGKHSVKFKIMNPLKDYEIESPQVIIYSDKPVNGLTANKK
ncbi:MAG: ADP-ribosylglycohydrolase family protein, partial [Ginsengibacter sp.]